MSAYGTPDTYPYEEIEKECPKCGKKSKGKFCSYCGAAMEKVSATKAEKSGDGPTKKCKHCQSDIPKKAKVCPVCRKKQGGKLKWIFLVIFILLLLPLVDSSDGTDETENLSPEQYKSECIDVSYEELARKPDEYEGQKVKFRGEIMQVVNDSDSGTSEYLISVTEGDYGLWDDNVFVKLSSDNKTEKFLEDDIVTFYGKSAGEYKYKSLLGQSIAVPCVKAVYMEISE
nr:MAG TPA: putative cytoplasmic protein [Caudoviricetes sp.]